MSMAMSMYDCMLQRRSGACEYAASISTQEGERSQRIGENSVCIILNDRRARELEII